MFRKRGASYIEVQITLWREMSEAQEFIRTTRSRDCYDACGIVAPVGSAKVVKVAGDWSHPISRGTPCGKCAVAWNLGKSGDGFLYTNRFGGRGVDINDITRPVLYCGGKGVVSYMDFADILEEVERGSILRLRVESAAD